MKSPELVAWEKKAAALWRAYLSAKHGYGQAERKWEKAPEDADKKMWLDAVVAASAELTTAEGRVRHHTREKPSR